jgi:hypothetical protein
MLSRPIATFDALDIPGIADIAPDDGALIADNAFATPL